MNNQKTRSFKSQYVKLVSYNTTTVNNYRDKTITVAQRRFSSLKITHDEIFVVTSLLRKARKERSCATKRRTIVAQKYLHDELKLRRTKLKGMKHIRHLCKGTKIFVVQG